MRDLQRLSDKEKKHRDDLFVEFDDDDKGWVDFHATKIYLLSSDGDAPGIGMGTE